jgi:hypothetical protein
VKRKLNNIRVLLIQKCPNFLVNIPCLNLIGFISIEEAEKNAKMSTDDLVPFDRTKIRGRVSSDTGLFSGNSTRPSSSASTSSEISSAGVSIGGEK